MMKRTTILLMGLFLLRGSLSAKMRVWHSRDGASFEGEYVDERLDRYYFRDQDGKTRIIPVKDLVPYDEKYIRSMVPPEITVRFSKSESIPQGEYADDDTTIIDGKLVITKKSRQPFYGKLHGELYYVGAEVATDDYKMLAKKKFTVQFAEDEKNPAVEITLTAEARVYEEYDRFGYRGRKYDGYVLVILSPSGEIMEFKTDIHWLTEDKLEAFRQMKEYYFFNEECKRRPVPRPKYYVGRGYMS